MSSFLVALCIMCTHAVQVLSGFHKRGIACLAFSASGALLATIGLDDDHSVAVYSVAGVTRHLYSISTT
jgi:WD40 repeat protein